MKKLLFFCVASFFCLNSEAQTTGWLHQYPSTDKLHSIQLLPAGYAFIAYDGIETYQIRVGLDGHPTDTIVLGSVPDDIVPSSDGGFFKGYLQNTNIRLQKLNTSGGLVWEKTLNDSLLLHYLRLSATPDGGCYCVCAKANASADGVPQTIIHRIAADGAALWVRHADLLNNWGNNTSRRILDALTLPDSSCIILNSDVWDGYHGAGHLYQIKPNGDDGFRVGHNYTWNYAMGGNFIITRPAINGDFLAMGNRWSSSTPGGHPEYRSSGFSIRITPQNGTVETSEADYPPTVSQTGTTYAPYPLAATPLSNGDMLVLIQDHLETRLWRGSWDLKDTSWERLLNVPEGISYTAIERPNRIMYGTPDGGAIIGGQNYAGIFLMKIGPWGTDSTAVYHTAEGHVLEDTDMDCQTPGPYIPASGLRVRYTSVDNPAHRWWSVADSSGLVTAPLPAGLWRAEVADKVDAIYGKSCVEDTLLMVSDTLSNPAFQIPVLRYKARLYGRVGIDQHSNCLFNGGVWGISGQRLQVMKDGKKYFITPDLQGNFSVSVDTGRYQMQIENYNPSVFKGYYCQGNEAYLPDYQSKDSLTLIWSYLKNCKIRVQMRRDNDYDCLPASGDADWGRAPVSFKDVASGETIKSGSNSNGIAEWMIYGAGDLALGFLPNFGDSLICSPALPHTFHYHFWENDQLYIDTLVGRNPRLEDSTYTCAGYSYFGVYVTKDTTFKATISYLNYLPVEVTHHFFVSPTWQIVLNIVDTTLLADSIQVLYLKTVQGCDSIVYVHYLTTGTKDVGGVLPLRLSPNPSTGNVNVQLPTADVSCLIVSDISGKTLRRIDVPTGINQYTLSLDGLPTGVYMLRAFRENGGCFVGKVMLE